MTCVALTVVGFNVNVGVYMAISMVFVDSGGLCSRLMWAASTVVGFDTSTCMALTVVGFEVSAGVYMAFVGGVGHQRLSGDRLCLLTGAEVDSDVAFFRLVGGSGGHDDKGSWAPTSLDKGRGVLT